MSSPDSVTGIIRDVLPCLPSITIAGTPGVCSRSGAPLPPLLADSGGTPNSQSRSTYTQAETKGTDFWLTFGKNAYHSISEVTLQIRIVGGDEAATGIIYFTHSGISIPFSVGAGEVYTYDFSDAEKQAADNDFFESTITDYSVHITTSAPVTAYALNQALYQTDATNILPITSLGTDYYHVSYNPYDAYYDAYAVVAFKNATKVFHNGEIAATLDAGQVYYRTAPNDMTGVHITTNKQVAFFAMCQNASIPVGGYSGRDHLFQQLAPVHTWGTNFFVPVGFGKNRVRIMVARNGTTITQTGGTIQSDTGGQTELTNLSAGQWVELEVSLANNGCYIQSDKPIGVCTYLVSRDYNPEYDTDPSQAWLPSIEQTISSALIAPFIPSGATNLDAHYAMIVTPTATKTTTTVAIGGATPVALSGGTWYDHSSGYSFYSMPLTSFTASYLYANAEGLFVMGYSAGSYETYYYLSASAMRTLNNTELEICAGTNVVFETDIINNGGAAPSYQWYNNDIPVGTASSYCYVPGNGDVITCKLTSNALCATPDTAISQSITMRVYDKPTIGTFTAPSSSSFCSGDVLNIVAPDVQNNGTPLTDYNWVLNNAIITMPYILTFANDGDTLFYRATNNCGTTVSTDTLFLWVKDKPTFTKLLMQPEAVCAGSTLTLKPPKGEIKWNNSSSTGPATWTLNGDIIDNTTPMTMGYNGGTLTYSVVDECGITVSNPVIVTVLPMPSASITAYPDRVCSGGPAILTSEVSGGTTTAMTYTWYEGSTLLGRTDISNYTVSAVTATAVYSVDVVNSYGCLSSPSTLTVTTIEIYSLPVTTILAVPNPVCYSGTSTLNAAVSAAGTTTAMTYTWNRGATQIGITNDDVNTYNLSSLTADADYSVWVLNENGCFWISDTISIRINPLPVVELSVSHDVVCFGDAATLTAIVTGGATTAMTYTWYAGTTLLGTNTSGSYFSSLTATAIYSVVATNSYGCETQGGLNISVIVPPYVIAMDDRRICYGDEITLTTFSYDGDDITWSVPQTTMRHTASSYYIVTVTRPPCLPARDTVRITVGDSLYIHPVQLPDFQRSRLYELQLQSNAPLPLYTIVSGQLPSGITLHRDGLLSGVCMFKQNDPADYSFTIEALDDYGCTVFRNYSLHLSFFVPLVFSPNGDGINDYFMLGYKVIIFDRLGLKVFEGTNGWDGTSNGKAASNDTYYYILFHTNTKGEELETTGSITLLR